MSKLRRLNVGRSRVRRLLWAVVILVALPAVLLTAASLLIPRDRVAQEMAQRVAAETGLFHGNLEVVGVEHLALDELCTGIEACACH